MTELKNWPLCISAISYIFSSRFTPSAAVILPRKNCVQKLLLWLLCHLGLNILWWCSYWIDG